MKVKFEFDKEKIIDTLRDVEVEALNKQAEEIANLLANNTPVNKRGKYKDSTKKLSESVVIEKATKEKRYLRIGYDGEHNHVGRFVNDGTIYQQPQEQVDKTSDEVRVSIIPKIKRNIRI